MSRYLPETAPSGRSPSAAGLISAGFTLLGGLVIGAGALYLFDPDQGSSRRRYLRRTAGEALHSAGNLVGSAYNSATDVASDLLAQSQAAASRMVDQHTEAAEEGGICPVAMLATVVGGSAIAAAAYLLATEYDTIRRGDLSGAVTHACRRASDAVSSGTHYLKEATGMTSESHSY